MGHLDGAFGLPVGAASARSSADPLAVVELLERAAVPNRIKPGRYVALEQVADSLHKKGVRDIRDSA